MEPTDKKEYEIAYLAKTEEDAAHIVTLVRAEGEVKEERAASRLKLAYPIEKEIEALFGVMKVMLEPAFAKRLEDTFRMDKRVLRSMIITTDATSKKGEMNRGEPSVPRTSRPSEQKSMPLSNEALEKTIEEILQ